MSLRRFVFKRLLITVPLLLGVTLATFLMVHFIPGDPIDFITLFTELDPETEQQIREQYGLNKPVYIQYIDWVVGAARATSAGRSSRTARSPTRSRPGCRSRC